MKKTIHVPLHLIDMAGNGCHLYLEAIFNNKTTGNLIIDTGASKTVFDKNSVSEYAETIPYDEVISNLDTQKMKEKMSEEELEELGINDDGMLSIGVTPGHIDFEFGLFKSMKIGELIIPDYIGAFIDLSNVNNLYEKINSLKVSGLLGSDFLLQYNAIIDYKNMRLVMEYENNQVESEIEMVIE